MPVTCQDSPGMINPRKDELTKKMPKEIVSMIIIILTFAEQGRKGSCSGIFPLIH